MGKIIYIDLLWEEGHIQGFCYGERSYTRILLWEKVIYKDFVVGEDHIHGLF